MQSCASFLEICWKRLEACGRMTEGEKFIHLGSRVDMGLLTIIMDNSFHGHFKQERGKYPSSKREDFGVGLSSIQAVAASAAATPFRGGEQRVSLFCVCADIAVFLANSF